MIYILDVPFSEASIYAPSPIYVLRNILKKNGLQNITKDLNLLFVKYLLEDINLKRYFMKDKIFWDFLKENNISPHELKSYIFKEVILLLKMQIGKIDTLEQLVDFNFDTYLENPNSPLVYFISDKLNFIKEKERNIYLISIRYNINLFSGLLIANYIKSIDKKSKIILGGSYFIVTTNENIKYILEKFDCIDYISNGQAETNLLDLVGSILNKKRDFSGIPNLFFRNNKDIVFTFSKYPEFLENISIERKEFEEYFEPREVPVNNGLGCYWNRCVYCNFQKLKKQLIISSQKVVDFFEDSINKLNCTLFSLNTECLYENKSEELYEEFSKEKYNALKENNILIPKELNEKNKIIEKYNQEIMYHIKNNSFAELIQEIQIIPSYQCNLRCIYCSSSITSVNKRNEVITYNRIKDILQQYVALLKRSSLKSHGKLSVRFFGGEPLLNSNFIEKTIKFINYSELSKIKDKISYVINTNGTIYNKKFIDFCLRNNVKFTVSLDGITESQNRLRIYRNGKPSFRNVKNNLKRFVDLGLTEGIIMVLNENNMDNAKEIISYIKAIGIKFLAVENLRFMLKRNKKFYKKYCNSLFEYYITGLRNDILIGGQWSRLINIFSKDLNCRNYYCGANGGIFCVHPSGRITACHTISAPQFDSLNDFLNSKYFKNGIRRNYIIDKCKGCEIEGICMGNCRAENESIYKDNGCTFNKAMFRNLLDNFFKLKEIEKTYKRNEEVIKNGKIREIKKIQG